MPNYCNYTMRIRGKEENRKKWIELMENYELENHFWRIFSDGLVVDKDWFDEENCTVISGYCAWSIGSCCRESGYSEGKDLLAINSRDLNLDVEVWSEEPGCGFQEHYIYCKGVCLAADCVDMTEYIWDTEEYENFEDYKKEHNVPDGIKESDFEGDDVYLTYIDGGFEYYMDWDGWPDTPETIQVLRKIECDDGSTELTIIDDKNEVWNIGTIKEGRTSWKKRVK